MNLPVDKLNRDEIYTFICGLFVGIACYLHFQDLGLIAKTTDVLHPPLLFSWLFLTGLLYISYAVLIWVSDQICRSRIRNQTVADDNKELEKMGLTKSTSFFWSGPLEEQYLLLHISGLLTVALLLVYHPVLAFISSRLNVFWFSMIHLAYSGTTVAAYMMMSEKNQYLHQVKNFLDKNYCDTLDQATYQRERASLYAKVQHGIYLAYLMKPSSEDQGHGSPDRQAQ